MSKFCFLLKVLILPALVFFLLSCNNQFHSDQLKEGFINPPDSARPGVYWYFMDGNLDRKAMTADLESMKKAGIGYVLFLEVNVGIPRGTVDCLSEEWQELFTHAVRECERLGIRLIMGSGPGWAGSGGPWVKPSQSMLHLVSHDTLVNGPQSFHSILPLPKPMKPFFGEGSLTPTLREIRNKWYEDVVVLAFPTPDNPARINCINEKALYYRAPFTSQVGVLPYLTIDGKNDIKGSPVLKEKIIDISGHLTGDGMLSWDVPPGQWTIIRFGVRNNGAVTRPAPQPGLGFECDKFDTAAFDSHYESYIGKLIRRSSPKKTKTGGGWTMIHIDSWEMGAQNWSPNFREEFFKRRGYDPLPFLPVYSGLVVENKEISERFLWDVRQTSNELIVENHALRYKELGRRSGFRLSVEPYDMNPASDLDLGYSADVPMCEFWSDGFGFNSSFSCLEATSIAHVSGASVVAAESFTAGSSEAWKKYPGNMKNQGDWAFCTGINRLIYHTFAHKPYGDNLKPGVTMGPYGVHWDRGQTWWPMVDAYHKYITRCQYLLSQGKSVFDILYLVPEGAPQVFRPPSTAMSGTDVMPDKKGYAFDGCSPAFLINHAAARNGKIIFPGGSEYSILVLPETRTMTPDLLKKIKALIKDGAVVMGNPPEKSPSLSGYPGCDEEVTALVREIWGDYKLADEGKKSVYWTGSLYCGKGLKNNHLGKSGDPDSLTLFPDFETTASILRDNGITTDFESSSGNIRYTHRSLDSREIYFISNKKDSSYTDTCWFRNGSKNAEIWNPVTGEIKPLYIQTARNGKVGLAVRFDSWESFFIVFYKGDGNKDLTGSQTNNFPDKTICFKLDGRWDVSFDTTWGGPANIIFEKLSDWTTHTDSGIKYYSGIAKYSQTFNLPDSVLKNEDPEIFLNLGKVFNIAHVKLNGKDLGVVWTSPWELKVTGVLKSRNNHLEIDVANLWINRLIGDELQPWDGIENGKWPLWMLNETVRPTNRYAFTTHRFYKSTDSLVESGLLGPVTIQMNKNKQ